MHLGASGEERVGAGLGRDDAVDDQLVVGDAQLAQLGNCALGLFDGHSLGVQHEDEGRGRGVAHQGHRALVLVLGVLNRRRRANAGLTAALAGSIDGLAPLGRQFQQAQGGASGRGVEDHDVEGLAVGRRRVEKVGEAVEGGHLGGARTTHLLFHHLHHLRWESGANGRHGVVDVLLGGLVRVDLHGPQVRYAGDGRDLVADGLLEDVGQVGGRVGGNDQGALAFVGKAHSLGAGHAGLAHAALTGEKEKMCAHAVTPFNADLTSVRVGYAPTLTTWPCTTLIGSAAIWRSRTSRITSALLRKAWGWLFI